MPAAIIAGVIPDLVALGVVAQTVKATQPKKRMKRKKKMVKKQYGGLADAIVNGRL